MKQSQQNVQDREPVKRGDRSPKSTGRNKEIEDLRRRRGKNRPSSIRSIDYEHYSVLKEPKSEPERPHRAISENIEDFADNKETAQKGSRRPISVRHRVTCSNKFRELVMARYPILLENESYCRMMQYLLFSGERKKGTYKVPLDYDRLASFEGKEKQSQGNNYRAIDFLKAFKRDVLPRFEWNKPVPRKLCRTLKVLGICEEILSARDIELSTPISDVEDRVYFDSGTRYTRKDHSKHRKTIQEIAKEATRHASSEATRRALEHMNNLHPHRYRKIIGHMSEAYNAARAIEDDNKRLAALQTLRAIEDQPQPFYQPSHKGNSVRVFSLGETMLTLQKEIRRILTQDWAEFDLRSSQLAICSVTWDVPLVREFLRSGQSIWDSLFQHLGLDVDETNQSQIKGPLKKALYSLMYGMHRSGVSRRVNQGLQEWAEKPSKRFWSHPVIRAMYKAREKQLTKIRLNGGAYDCFGDWIALTDKVKDTSVLAQLAQAEELRILLPVFELAEGTEEFSITLWQHDGFSAAFKNAGRKDRWIDRIVGIVNETAQSLGFPTELEVT